MSKKVKVQIIEQNISNEKQNLGEKLYPIIKRTQPMLAGKITGMLLEMDNPDILHLLNSKKDLNDKIDEALKVLEDHNRRITQKLYDITEDCPICMESLGKNDVCVTKCGHKFCTSCLLQSAQNNTDCPLCRTELAPKRDLITRDDLETAYFEGREDGVEELIREQHEKDRLLRAKFKFLKDVALQKYSEIESLKEKVSMLEEHVENSKKKWYLEGSKIGMQIHAKYLRSKELSRECDKKPLTIDDWFKLRMENK